MDSSYELIPNDASFLSIYSFSLVVNTIGCLSYCDGHAVEYLPFPCFINNFGSLHINPLFMVLFCINILFVPFKGNPVKSISASLISLPDCGDESADF